MGQKDSKGTGTEEKQLRLPTVKKAKEKQKKSKGTIVLQEKCITCIFTNADAVTNKLAELETLLAIHKPDIVGVIEVKPKNIAIPLTKTKLRIKGYELLPNNQCFTDEGRGVCLYVHESILGSCIEYKVNMGVEAVWIKVKLGNNEVMKLGCVYRSPNSTEDNVTLNSQMKSLKRSALLTMKISSFLVTLTILRLIGLSAVVQKIQSILLHFSWRVL